MFLLPYSAALSIEPGEWGEGSSWPRSLTQAAEPQEEISVFLISCRLEDKIGQRINLGPRKFGFTSRTQRKEECHIS